MDLDMDFSHTPVVAWSSLFTIQDPLGNQQNLVWWIPLPNTPWDYVHRLQLTEVTSCISKCLSKKKHLAYWNARIFSNLFLLISCSIDHFYLHRKSGEEVFRGPATMLGTLGPNLVERVWLRDMRQRRLLAGTEPGIYFFSLLGGLTILIYIKI